MIQRNREKKMGKIRLNKSRKKKGSRNDDDIASDEDLRHRHREQKTKKREMNELIKAIKNINSWNGVDINNNEVLRQQYEQISDRISLFLPRNSNPSLCEIDDLILPNCNQLTDNSLRFQPGKKLSCLVDYSCSFYYNLAYIKGINYSLFIGPLTQLIDISGEIQCRSLVLNQAENLIETWNLKNACLALKAMRVVADKDERFKNAESQKIKYESSSFWSSEIIAWLHKIRNLPQPNCPEKHRIASWMRRQSEAILGGYKNKYFEIFKNWEKRVSAWMLDPSPVFTLLGTYRNYPFQLDHLYSFFMSSNRERQRIGLIKHFINGCLEMYDVHGATPTKEIMPDNTLFLYYMRYLVEIFCEYFYEVINGQHQEAKWIEIQKYLRGYRREPYLSKKSGDFTGVRIWDSQQEGHGVLTPSLNPESSSEDLTIEKHIFFDIFLNRLELMNIVRTAFWKTAEILQMESFPEGYEAMVFWVNCGPCTPKHNIIRQVSGEKPGSIPRSWLKWYEFTMRMCPFLYFPRGREVYADDLLNVLKGEEVDEAILDELYFAVNNMPVIKDQNSHETLNEYYP